MKRRRIKQGLALVMALFLAITPLWGSDSGVVLISFAEPGRTARVNATTLNVRTGPGTNYSASGKLTNGKSVTVLSETTGSDGKLWYQISFVGSNGASATGYVRSDYIKFSASYTNDSSFESYLSDQGFPDSYKDSLRQLHAEYPNWVFKAQHTNLEWETVISNESLVGRNLVYTGSISSWKSTADGAYNWDTSTWPGFDSSSYVAASEGIIRYYMDPRNFLDDKYVFQFLVHSYNESSHTAQELSTMVQGTFLGSGTVTGGSENQGSGGISQGPGSSLGGSGQIQGPGVSLQGPGGSSQSTGNGSTSGSPGQSGSGAGTGSGAAVIPGAAPGRNGSSNVSLQGPSASISKKETNRVMASIVTGVNGGPGVSQGPGGGSSSAGTAPQTAYVDILMSAAKQSGVNPFVLAAMILQEQGNDGSGRCICGTVPGYVGYYNFFNIEAYQSGSMDAISRGLWYASQSGSYERPWNSVDKAIIGGAIYYGTNYVNVGQDTFYLKKFNVQGSNLYKHQYMTNVQAAAAEGAKLAEAYGTQMKQSALEFKIPVYRDMPAAASAKPTGDGSPNNKLSGLSVEGFALTPTFNRDTTAYNLIVSPTVSQVTVNATPLASTAAVSGTGIIQLQNGSNEIRISVTAQNGTIRQYIIYVVRQEGGPAGSGTSSFTGNGISGYGPGSGSPAPTGSGQTSGIGPGGSSSQSVSPSSTGPGASGGSGSGGSAGGPGGSNVTIVQ